MSAVKFHSDSEHCETPCDHLALDHYSGRNIQGYIGKAPDIPDPEGDKFVCNLLRRST